MEAGGSHGNREQATARAAERLKDALQEQRALLQQMRLEDESVLDKQRAVAAELCFDLAKLDPQGGPREW